MKNTYFLRRITFPEYMIKLLHLHPLLRIQKIGLRLHRQEFIEVMRPMMNYKHSNKFLMQKRTTWMSYREIIKEIIQETRLLFSLHFLYPERKGRLMVCSSTIFTDAHRRLSANEMLKNLILAYIVVTVMLIIYIEYNIFLRTH